MRSPYNRAGQHTQLSERTLIQRTMLAGTIGVAVLFGPLGYQAGSLKERIVNSRDAARAEAYRSCHTALSSVADMREPTSGRKWNIGQRLPDARLVEACKAVGKVSITVTRLPQQEGARMHVTADSQTPGQLRAGEVEATEASGWNRRSSIVGMIVGGLTMGGVAACVVGAARSAKGA